MLVSVDDPGDAGTEQPVRTSGDLYRDLGTGVGVGAEADAEFLSADDRVVEGLVLAGECFQASINGEPVSVVKAVACVEADQLEERAQVGVPDPAARQHGVRARRLPARATIRAWVDGFGWAAAGAAFFVGIDRVVLELVVEADVMHLLEDVVLVARDLDGAAAPSAYQRLGWR